MKIGLETSGALSIYGGQDAMLLINGNSICYNHAHYLKPGDILTANGQDYVAKGRYNDLMYFEGFPVGASIEVLDVEIAGCPACMDSPSILEGHDYCHYPSTKWIKLWEEGEADVILQDGTWHISLKESQKAEFYRNLKQDAHLHLKYPRG